MKRFILSLILLLVQLTPMVLAEITKTATLVPIKAAIKEADQNTLIVFDVDEVLVTAKDQILHPQHKKRRTEFWQDFATRYSQKEQEKFWSIGMLGRQDELVDPDIVPLIQETQSKGIKVVALTHCPTGLLGKIPSVEGWRIKELNRFGINFQTSWPDVPAHKFDGLTPSIPGRLPAFQGGILFTAMVPKGDVLEAFLTYLNGLWQKKMGVPQFEDYPAEETPFIPAKNIDLASHPFARTYRTLLRSGFKEAVKAYQGDTKLDREQGMFFAGHYCIICDFIVDLKTGKIVDYIRLDFGRNDIGVNVQRNSRLLITGNEILHNGEPGLAFALDVICYEIDETSSTKKQKPLKLNEWLKINKCQMMKDCTSLEPMTLKRIAIFKKEDIKKMSPPCYRKIIFVDDKRENLDAVQKICNHLDIDFLGFEYMAVASRPTMPLNEERSRL